MTVIHTAICDWFSLDPAHYEYMGIEPLGDDCYRITWLNDRVSDWRFTFDEDNTVLDGTCYQEVI